MRPIHYIGILSFMGYVHCLPLAGQVKEKVAREGNPRLEYTEVKTERSTDGKTLAISFNVTGSVNRLGAQEMLYVYPSLVSSDGNTGVNFPPLCISGKDKIQGCCPQENSGRKPGHIGFGEGYP